VNSNVTVLQLMCIEIDINIWAQKDELSRAPHIKMFFCSCSFTLLRTKQRHMVQPTANKTATPNINKTEKVTFSLLHAYRQQMQL